MQNIRKRYAADCSSSNLLDDERHHDTDTLAAVALGTSEFGAALLRAKHAQWISSRLRDQWREMVAGKAVKIGCVNLAEEAADISMWAYLDDGICITCKGRTFQQIENTPKLSGIVCPDCSGTGKQARVFDAEIRDAVLFCINWLARVEGMSAGGAGRKLQGDE